MKRNILKIAGRCVAALALLFLAGCVPATPGGPVTPFDNPTVRPLGTAIPAPTLSVAPAGTAIPAPTQSVLPLGTAIPAPTLAATEAVTGTVIAPPELTPQPEGTAGQLAVTQADAGKTISLPVGDRFLLNLGEDYNWNVVIDKQDVVSRVIGVLTIRGSQGLYEAHQPGTVTLTATGDPVCRQAKPPCSRPSILFKVTIIVK